MSTKKSSIELKTTKQYVFLILMAAFYILSGVNHFLNPDMYVKMIPPFLPSPELLNLVSGGAEIVLGVFLLIPVCRQVAALGVILLLIAVYPANIYMALSPEQFGVPLWLALVRLPIQFLLIAWAYYYARPLRSFLPAGN